MPRTGGAAANNTLNAWFRNATFVTLTGQMQVSLHSGDPGSTGANEIAGAGYARQNVVFGIPSGNAVALLSTPLQFSGMPGCSVAGSGTWCGSTFLQGGMLQGGPQSVSLGQTFTLSALQAGFA